MAPNVLGVPSANPHEGCAVAEGARSSVDRPHVKSRRDEANTRSCALLASARPRSTPTRPIRPGQRWARHSPGATAVASKATSAPPTEATERQGISATAGTARRTSGFGDSGIDLCQSAVTNRTRVGDRFPLDCAPSRRSRTGSSNPLSSHQQVSRHMPGRFTRVAADPQVRRATEMIRWVAQRTPSTWLAGPRQR